MKFNRRFKSLLILIIQSFVILNGTDAWSAKFSGKIPGMILTGLGNAAQVRVISSGTNSTTDGLLTFGGGILQEFGTKSKKPFRFQTGLLFHQKKYGFENRYNYTSSWLQLPLLARGGYKAVTLGLGGYVDFKLGSVAFQNLASVIPPLTTSLKSVDYGALFALSATVFKNFYLDFRYSLGLANVSQGTPESMKFNEAMLLFGLRMD